MYNENKITIEAVSSDISLNPRGEEKELTNINSKNNTSDKLEIYKKLDIKLQVKNEALTYLLLDKNNQVLNIIDDDNRVSELLNSKEVEYVILASGNNKKFLKNKFKKHDVIKFRINGEVTSTESILNLNEITEEITLNIDNFITTNESSIDIDIIYKNLISEKIYTLQVNNENETELKEKLKINLISGVNYISISLKCKENVVDRKTVIIYRKSKEIEKNHILWFDQFPSALLLNSLENIEKVLKKVKSSGFTGCVIVVKGTEGYVSYKKNTLSKSPYISEIKVKSKKGMDANRDLLQDFIEVSKKYNLKVYAAINVMTEGNITGEDCPLIDLYQDWEEVLQRPEDKGKLLPARKSSSKNILLYINPANDNAIDYQLKRYEEILLNYDVDGIVLDRCRFDNKFSDFSELTKSKFKIYLNKKGKTLNKWPDDIFKIKEDGSIEEGNHYVEWWKFRSSIINDIVAKVRSLVDKYAKEKNKELTLSSYVGSWYEIIYENGLNWASKDFVYDNRLEFAEDRIYGKEYSNTSYIDKIDFIITGNYYKTVKEISKYVTIGNILINESIPLISGISLYDIEGDENIKKAYTVANKYSDGTMTFDAEKIIE